MSRQAVQPKETPASVGGESEPTVVRRGGLPGRIHLLGAGGAGISGVGRVLQAQGVEVTGHDRVDSAMLEALRATGIAVERGESRPEHLPEDVELVIRSTAVPLDDPQVVAAQERGIPVIKYAEALGRLAPPEHTLAVAGTHGKTSTAWMLWYVLEGIAEELRLPVSGALIGGLCRRLGTSSLAGSHGGWFCVEACEYDRTFLHLAPRGAAITNVEEEHLDYYGDLEAILAAFARFACNVDEDGLLVLGRDVPEEVELGSKARIWRLGREIEIDLLGEDRGCFRFRLRLPGFATPPVTLGVPGHFNVENAALALAQGIGLGPGRTNLSQSRIAAAGARGIERFVGVDRRFELWGDEGGAAVVHDYAHHPTEVRVTLETARRAFPDRPLHVLFQPHQHSRTSRFLTEFAEGLRSADRVVVSDVYGARPHVDGAKFATAYDLVMALRRRLVDAVEGGPLDSAVEHLVSGLPERSAALVLGAGDVEMVRDELFGKLAVRCAPSGEPGA